MAKATKTKNEQQLRKLELKHFDLSKAKLSKKGMDVIFFENGNKHTDEYNGEPHTDLIQLFDRLKLYMAMRLDLLSGWDFAREKCKKDNEALQEAITSHKDCINRCKISGISIVGENSLRAVKITGSVKCGDSSVGLATPNINFASEKLGYEQDVDSLCEEIREEVYNYVFNNKRAQLDLEDEANKAEKENELFGDDSQ